MKHFFLVSLLLFLPSLCLPVDKVVSCVIHVHSNYSSADNLSLTDVAKTAREKGLNAVILSDHDMMNIEYGIFPLRNILKKNVKGPSVLELGAEKYITEAALSAKEDSKSLILIPGLESAAFYWWSGNFFNKTLTMNDWHRHILVLGLDKVDDISKLPVLSNKSAYRFNPFLLWPLSLFALSWMLSRFKTIKIFLILSGFLFTINYYPFTRHDFNQYHGYQGFKPYQRLIDYANTLGALTIIAHPEARNWYPAVRFGPVQAQTKPYPESLLELKNYTGFAVFGEGYTQCAKPGGFWDKALSEYCHGKRTQAPWAFAEVDFSNRADSIDYALNKILAADLSRKSVLDSLRNGRFYSVWKDKNWELKLDKFRVSSWKDSCGMGEELLLNRTTSNELKISFNLSAGDFKEHKIKITLIKNAKILQTFETVTPCTVNYLDHLSDEKFKSYYRLDVTSEKNTLITNPIFISRK